MDFGKKPAAPAPKQEFDSAKMFTWAKALESKLNGLRREFDLVKNNSTRSGQDTKQNIQNINSELTELQHKVSKMDEKLDLIVAELKRTAGSEELDVLKKYIEFWNPMEFVTQKDIDRIVEQKMQDFKHNSDSPDKQEQAQDIKNTED
ncbi:hypothetical protein CL619_00945 [archaeon]|nr:hypothetical protein [archaeon]|tara:strand:- start:2396 stop:2839 length:444 start_codon:yes stop_codon:yes gene_type:complete